MFHQVWPYPKIIAHRGGGSLAPENTLAAIDVGHVYGHRMIEFDVKLSRDGQLFLLHDDRLERTSNGCGIASDRPWDELLTLDVGSWYGPIFRHQRLPLLSQVAERCMDLNLAANIEIKPTTGMEASTGREVALMAKHFWREHAIPPLLSSFSFVALAEAQKVTPELPRGLLLSRWDERWQGWVKELECFSLHFHHRALTAKRVEAMKSAGYFVLAYTVNSPRRVKRLFEWGVDAVFTDCIDLIGPDFGCSADNYR